MSKKVNWAEVDKRIRDRRKDFSAEEMKTVQTALDKLPDLAEEVEIIDIPQPAVAPPEEEGEDGAEGAEKSEDQTEEPN